MNKLIFKYFIYDLGLHELFDSILRNFLKNKINADDIKLYNEYLYEKNHFIHEFKLSTTMPYAVWKIYYDRMYKDFYTYKAYSEQLFCVKHRFAKRMVPPIR